jgi:hypothetical protein
MNLALLLEVVVWCSEDVKDNILDFFLLLYEKHFLLKQLLVETDNIIFYCNLIFGDEQKRNVKKETKEKRF